MTAEHNMDDIIEDYEKQIFDLKQLIEISKSLNSNLDYNLLTSSILYTCMAQMKVLNAGLLARKSFLDHTFALHRNYKGFDLDHSIDYSIREDHPLIRYLSDTNRCLTLREVKRKLGSLEGLDAIVHLKPELLVPLKAKDQINGIIVLGDRIDGGKFDDSEKNYMLNIATFASIGIHNAFLFEMTSTDMMTKLKTKHFFLNMLLEMLEESVHKDTPLSLIMMDIDHFKNLNDTFGHICGDVVLQKVAAIIQENIRQIDTGARYGGEEFAVILPETSMETAIKVAERIRVSLQDTPIEYENSLHHVTISLGVAMFDPLIDITSMRFIDRADKALYRSKQNGRNLVTIA